MPKDILYGEPPVSWQSVSCSLFQRGVPGKNTGTELSEQYRRKTDPMDASAWIRARVSADVSGRIRIFLFLFTATALLCDALLEKTNKFLGLKNLDSCSF